MADIPYSIIGGGLMGAALAYYLSSAGKKVLLIDDERVGRASGWNPGGINPLHGPGFPGLMQKFYLDAYNQHLMHHAKIKDLSGIDFYQKIVSRVFLAKSKIDLDELEKSFYFYNALPNFSGELLDRKALLKFDARISPELEGGLLTKGNMRLDSERFRLALLSSANKLGAKVISGTLSKVLSINELITHIYVGDLKFQVSGLCMATGAWSNNSIDGWNPGCELNIKPMIGDLLFVQSFGDALKADIGYGIQSVYQHDTNHYWLGGTTRESGVLGACTLKTKQELIKGIRSLLPGWKSFRLIGQSSAARPMTANGLPVMGKTPSYLNGWVINGGGSKGVLLCLWMASVLSDQMIHNAMPENLQQFIPVSQD